MKNAPLLAIFISSSCYSFSQYFQNLDFEVIDDENPLPSKWYIIEEVGSEIRYNEIAYSGKKSLLIYPNIERRFTKED